MPQLRIPVEYDRRLKELSPLFLQGNRKIAQRIMWGIERLEELLNGAVGNGGPSSRPAETSKVEGRMPKVQSTF